MESLRPLLNTYAYNILGQVEEAKDVVQDAYLRFMKVDQSRIEDPKAYLVRTVINLAINQKKRQRKLIDHYPGNWLPEPVATETADTALLRKEVLSYSLMVLLEKLNARQRAVFILKEAFDYDHEEIAKALGITAENSRKILSRARTQIHEHTPEQEKTIPDGYLDKYMHVIRNGDIKKLEQLLSEDITILSDGGGKATAFLNPVHGPQSVGAALQGLYNKFYFNSKIEQKWINHQPALFYYEGDRLVTCQVFSLQDGRVADIYFIRNPDKLKGLI